MMVKNGFMQMAWARFFIETGKRGMGNPSGKCLVIGKVVPISILQCKCACRFGGAGMIIFEGTVWNNFTVRPS